MTATQVLKHEHQIVLLILGAAEREAKSIEETGKANTEEIEKMVEFFRNFVDRCHHAKEEKHLFPKMQECGLPRESGPIAVMLAEHEEGRQRVKGIAAALTQVIAGDSSALVTLRENLLAYAELLRAHIAKEDSVLFPMADRVVCAAAQQSLVEAFEKVEAEELDEGVHEKYHQLAHDLAGR